MSQSRHIYDRFRRRERRRKAVAFVYIAAMLAYLAWRTTILNTDAIGLSLMYFTAEVFGFVLGLTLVFCSWNFRHRQLPRAQNGLNVDIFVTTYKEPLELLRWTLIAAKEIDYPHRTFLLDDGNRPAMRALAEGLGVRYLAREKNIDAKAGNLNFGLAHSTADFVMVFDADHIALPHALDVTLGFFHDPRVAMVQAPQDYYNIDAFQYFNSRRGGLWHDQSFFYLIAQSCRDFFNGASCVGTSVVYRRSTLDAIGGIPVETVTEDIHTSLKFHKAGYEVVYLNESIAYGVAASDIRDYYRTRHRWAHGNIHALRIENTLFCKELTIGQKLSYLTLGLIYLEGWQQFLLFVVPMMSLFFGWAPFQITFLNVLLVLFFPLLTTLLLQELGCGLSRIWVNEIFSVARFPIHLMATAALVLGKMPFRTSAKNMRGRIEWSLMAPQLAVFVVSIIAVATGLVHLMVDFRVGPLAYATIALCTGKWANINWNLDLPQGYTLELVAVAGAWALFNAAKSGYLIRKAIIDARRSTDDYQFDARLPLELDTPSGRILARVDRLSRSWLSARVYDRDALAVGEQLTGRLHLPAGPLPVECVVTARPKSVIKKLSAGPLTIEIAGAKSFENEGRIECELVWPNSPLRDRLTRSLYSIDWHREFMHHNAFFATPLEVLGRFLTLRAPFGAKPPNWSPALYRDPNGFELAFAVISRSDVSGDVELLGFRALRADTVLDVEILGPEAIETQRIRVLGPEKLRSLAAKGIDGAVLRRFRAKAEEERVESVSAFLATAAE